LRKEIPIPHLNPPPSQREGGGFGEGPPPVSSLFPSFFLILPLPLGGGGYRWGRAI